VLGVAVIVGMDAPSGFAHLGPPFGFIMAVIAYKKTKMIIEGADLSPRQRQVLATGKRRWVAIASFVVGRWMLGLKKAESIHRYICTQMSIIGIAIANRGLFYDRVRKAVALKFEVQRCLS